MQKDLFDFGEEKKAKSENAIVKIEEKFGLKIKKARNLCLPLITGLFILFQFFNVQKLFAQSEKSLQGPVILSLPDETIIQQKEESSPFLFSDDNSDFSFETFGFWQVFLHLSLVLCRRSMPCTSWRDTFREDTVSHGAPCVYRF